MKFIEYLRVSVAKSGGLDSYGIGAQKEAVSRYVNSVGGEIVATFQEVESGANCQRPQLLAAVALALKLKCALCVAKLDRLSRDLYFLLTIQRSGVQIIFCDMPQADSLTINLMAMMAEHERKLISSRTKAGLAVARARGKRLGSPDPKRGWKVASEAIQKRKTAFNAAALKTITEIMETGVTSYSRLALYMNRRGEKTAMGKEWNAAGVRRVLLATRPGAAPVICEAAA